MSLRGSAHNRKCLDRKLFLQNRNAHCGGKVDLWPKPTIHHIRIQQKEGFNDISMKIFFPFKLPFNSTRSNQPWKQACCGIPTRVHPHLQRLTLNQYTTWWATHWACCFGNHWHSRSGFHVLFEGAWLSNDAGGSQERLTFCVFDSKVFRSSSNRECYSSARYTGFSGLSDDCWE